MKNHTNQNDIVADYYTRFYEDIKNFVGSKLHYADETEDIVQNTFVRLLQMKQMITPATLRSLVYTIANNLILDYWRHKKKAEEYEHFIRKADWTGKWSVDGESVYSATEIERLLEHSIALLSPKQRSVYRLNLYDGLQVSEIAQKMNYNYKYTENHLGKARKVVRNYLKEMLA